MRWLSCGVTVKGRVQRFGETVEAEAHYRRQRLVFEIAARLLRGQPGHEYLFPQAVREVEWYVDNKVTIEPRLPEGELDNQVYKTLIYQRISDQLRPGQDGSGRLLPVLDEYQPEGSTCNVRFLTSKPVEPTTKSHINYAVCDSELERRIAQALEASDRVVSYAKNDHLFCEIPYRFEGRVQRYIPDFLVRLANDRRLLIEGKGRATARDHSKTSAARRWVAAVNADGRWGDGLTTW
jgi:type III restriction enzyme